MRRALLLLAKATTSILLLYLSLHWVNVGALGERLSWFEFGLGCPRAFPADGSDRTRRRAVARNCHRMRREPGLHFGLADQLHCYILQSGSAVDSWRRQRTDLAVCAQGGRLGECDLFGID